MKRFLISLSCLFLAAVTLSAATEYNKYGMKLKVNEDGQYSVAGAGAYKKIAGINVKKLPDVLEPYKAKITCYDKASIKTVETEDVIYKTTKFGQEMHLMIYKSEQPFAPVVFYIHGGGWVAGSYTGGPKVFKTMAGKYGITVVSIEYTFATVEGATVEDSIQDCYDAVDFILGNADKYGIDNKRIGFVGSSAGGHLSAMCALHYPKTRAYVGWYGAYDLESSMEIYAPAAKEEKHARYNTYLKGWDPEYIRSFSPASVARTMKKIRFSTVLFAGTADVTIGYQNAPIFEDALRAGGARRVEIRTYENVTHSMFKSEYASEIYKQTMEFFKDNL